MNKVMLALGSFIVGACCAFLVLSLSNTSTRVQAFQERIGFAGPPAEPIVPPLTQHLKGGGVLNGTLQSLDGLDCDGCVLDVERFSYAGGAYRLNNAQLRTNAPVELKGAALNTINLLRALGALPNPPQKPKSKPPIVSMIALKMKAENGFTLVSLEGMQTR